MLLAAEAVAKVVHRAAAPLAFRILASVEDAEDVLGEVGHHAEEGDEPHPENGSGTADRDGSGHADDVAGADRRGEGRAERLELGDRAVLGMGRDVLVAEDLSDGVANPVSKVGNLEEFGEDRHQDADKAQKDQRRPAPDEAVDKVIDVCDNLNHISLP